MKFELILSFLMSLLMTIKSEAPANIFTLLENALVSTTIEPTTIEPATTEVPIIDIITKGWLQNIIDTVGLCGFIAILSGIVCCFLCCCVGTCCYIKRKRSGHSSFYEYYQGINITIFFIIYVSRYLCLILIAKSQTHSILCIQKQSKCNQSLFNHLSNCLYIFG